MRQVLPPDLAEMAPGPELSVLLTGIDIHALTGHDAVEVLQARARQLSHEQARLLATMVEVGLCDPDAGPGEVARLVEPALYAGDEIRAALAWTRRAAERELGFAEALVLRMPAVFRALEAGKIDRNKAWVFTDLCADLTPEQAEVVSTQLLSHVQRLTTGELAARIKKLALALDPEWAARRYAAAVRERNVIGYLDPDGTATVTGTGLPVDQAAAACARVEELARAAKRAGHPGRIGPLRTDIYLGLLDGRWQHHTRDQIITDLLTHAIKDHPDPGDPTEPTPTASPPEGQAPSGDATAPAAPGHPTVHGAPAQDGQAPDGQVQESDDGETGLAGPPTAGQPDAPKVGVEVRVKLTTLLGRDEHPGEVAGWGPVPAEVARTMVAAQRAAQWRFAITDTTGQLMLAGITRHRPPTTAPPGELPPCRGGIVELQLPATLLTELATDSDACGLWAAVIADLAVQYTRYIQGGCRGLDAQDTTARFAGAALRRHVQIRDRSCVYPGCRASAHSADLDHTVDHTDGGPTTSNNSGPLCRHDHRLKHAGQWRLHQPESGHFTWTSPLGRTYRTQPPPIIDDLPDPLPRLDDLDHPPVPTPEDDETPILERPPPQPDFPYPPPSAPPDSDEPPPF